MSVLASANRVHIAPQLSDLDFRFAEGSLQVFLSLTRSKFVTMVVTPFEGDEERSVPQDPSFSFPSPFRPSLPDGEVGKQTQLERNRAP